jgi:hypothetical protein
MRIFVMDDIRCRRPDRDQMFWDSVCLDEILPEDHPARMVWEVTGTAGFVVFL